MPQLARWLTFVEQFDFEVIHRAGNRHGNADSLSRRPVAVSDWLEVTSDVAVAPTFDAARPGPVNVQCIDVAVCRCTAEIRGNSAGEPPIDSDVSLEKRQQQDADIGPIVRMRLQQEQPPSFEELLAESEAAKVLHAQWCQLEVHNGLVYRRWIAKDGKPDALQLLVPVSLRLDYLRQAHAGMCGGHLGIKRTMDQIQRRAFWQSAGLMFAGFVVNVTIATVTSATNCQGQSRCNLC